MKIYTIKDWSLNPVTVTDIDLRSVINECDSLTDEQIVEVANLTEGQTFEGSEFSITCTGRTA